MSYMMLASAIKKTIPEKDRLEKAKRSSSMIVLLYNENKRRQEIHTIYEAEVKSNCIYLYLCDGGWVGLTCDNTELANQYLLKLYNERQLDLRCEEISDPVGIYGKME